MARAAEQAAEGLRGRVGAVTDGAPLGRQGDSMAALADGMKALTNHLSKQEADAAATSDRGKLASISREEEQLAFLARGCDRLTVPMCAGITGKELFHALRHLAVSARPLLRTVQWQVKLTNRIAFAYAGLRFGGRSLATVPKYALAPADFPRCTDEDLDAFVPPGDYSLEPNPRHPAVFTEWHRSTNRLIWCFGCVFGEEHRAQRYEAATRLVELHENHEVEWPASVIYDIWSELEWRWVEELKQLRRDLLRLIGDHAPTWDTLRFTALAPGADGAPWLRMPRTFDLSSAAEYFRTDIVPREQRRLQRAVLSMARKHVQPLRAGDGGGQVAGGDGGGATAGAPRVELLGPQLTREEAERAGGTPLA